jgi:predicted Co/Zn/Cd cation transporter (cation efflux family)
MLFGAGFGLLGIGWGLAASSQIILFDGIYAALSILLSWLSLRASRLVAQGASPRYPYGREALAPLVIAVQGMALLGTCLYAIVSSVLTILDGGSEVSAGSATVYAAITTMGTIVALLRMRSYSQSSELVAAEAEQWRASVLLSAAMLLAFGGVLLIADTSWAGAARYVDPVLVILACAAFLPAPYRMVRTTVVELLEGAPDESVQEPVRAVVREVAARFGLGEPVIRMSKLGTKLYLEVDHVVVTGEWDIADLDRLRTALTQGLATTPYDVWLNVDLSADPAWSRGPTRFSGP